MLGGPERFAPGPPPTVSVGEKLLSLARPAARYAERMRALLVRIGVDKTAGGWNAPLSPASLEFVYVPTPEARGQEFLRTHGFR